MKLNVKKNVIAFGVLVATVLVMLSNGTQAVFAADAKVGIENSVALQSTGGTFVISSVEKSENSSKHFLERNNDVEEKTIVQSGDSSSYFRTRVNESNEGLMLQLNLPKGAYVVRETDGFGDGDGSFTIYDKSDNIIGYTSQTGAIDAELQEIDVDIEITEEGQIIQYINSDNTDKIAYPIESYIEVKAVTASTDFYSYFNRGEWIVRDGVRSLSLYKTYAFPTISVLNAAWSTVVDKFGSSSYFYNESGMYDQFRCHNDFASWKDPWNLEPSRPDVSYLSTVMNGCNP